MNIEINEKVNERQSLMRPAMKEVQVNEREGKTELDAVRRRLDLSGAQRLLLTSPAATNPEPHRQSICTVLHSSSTDVAPLTNFNQTQDNNLQNFCQNPL